jgi:hypothetical protein
MKTTRLFALLLAGSTALHASDTEILSLTTNGRLTFTNSFTNGLFSVQWAPALPTTNWNGSWDSLRYFVPTNPLTTVSVPMFYRVTGLSNQFIPMAIGRQFLYTVTNLAGGTSTVQATFLAPARLSSDKDYTLLELRTPCELRLLPCRSTENEYYEIPFGISATEGLTWRRAPPGTMWTNQWCDGSSDQMTVATNEVITVPAGTFDCLRIEQREIDNNLRLNGVYWVKAGFIMVKYYVVEDGQTNIWSLASWADKPPR